MASLTFLYMLFHMSIEEISNQKKESYLL